MPSSHASISPGLADAGRFSAGGVSAAQVLCVLGQLPPQTESYTDLTRLFWAVRENHLVICKNSFASFAHPKVYKHS